MHTRDLVGISPGDGLDLRWTTVDEAKLKQILDCFFDRQLERPVLGDVRCDNARFIGEAYFGQAKFTGEAVFDGAVFGGFVSFGNADCCERMSFSDVRFEGRTLMLYSSVPSLYLDRARFAKPVEIRVDSESINCEDTWFEGGVTLWTSGKIDAGWTRFEAPSTISGAKLTSLASSEVSNLVLSDVDLSECTFLGVHRLEQIRIDGNTRFAISKKRWHARRRRLIEERYENPARVAALYRALRKSFEDSKNEAGAGDFYYGEMDCRRQSKESSRAERLILWCYWLLSGYGQRAWRAVTALFVVVATVTSLLTVWGQDFGMAARIAVGAVVFRDDRTELTAAGEWTVLVARFLGPVLLALAVLAVRARVKR